MASDANEAYQTTENLTSEQVTFFKKYLGYALKGARLCDEKANDDLAEPGFNEHRIVLDGLVNAIETAKDAIENGCASLCSEEVVTIKKTSVIDSYSITVNGYTICIPPPMMGWIYVRNFEEEKSLKDIKKTTGTFINLDISYSHKTGIVYVRLNIEDNRKRIFGPNSADNGVITTEKLVEIRLDFNALDVSGGDYEM